MKELKTRRLFADLIPPLSIDERGELENSIMDEGCRDAICVWNGVIVDGHNRYEICKRRGRAFRVKEMQFSNDEEAVAWIIRNQFGRRNLTAMQRAELALRLKESVAAEAKKRQVRKPKSVRENSHEQNERTDEQLATMAGVSSNTIRRVEKIVTQAAPAVVEAARKGELSINAAYRTVASKAEPKPAPMPQEAQKPPAEPPAPIADNHAPKADAAQQEPQKTPSQAPAPSAETPAPVRLLGECFKSWRDASKAIMPYLRKLKNKPHNELRMLYMGYIPGESRYNFLKRLDKEIGLNRYAKKRMWLIKGQETKAFPQTI